MSRYDIKQRMVNIMDKFVEQIEKKAKDMKDFLIKLATVSAVVILTLFCLALASFINFYFAMIAFFVLIGGIYVIWYVFSSLKVEYEYSTISGSITISKIMAKRKRKNVVAFEASQIEDLFKYDNRDFDARLYSHVYNLRGASSENQAYAAVFNSEKHGRSVVLFTPNEKFLEAMKPYLPRQLVINLFYKR